MTKRKLTTYILCLIACWHSVVHPDEPQSLPELEQLLYSPLNSAPKKISLNSRTTRSTQDASGTVYVITAEDIRALQLGTLAEILKLLPGLHILDDGVFTFLISRSIGQPGDYNSRLLFLLDGHRINENTAGAGLLSDEFFLNSQWIERVEYHPGAPSASYGSNAMLGVVHIFSKTPRNESAVEVSTKLSNQHDHQFSLLFNQKYGDLKSWLGISYDEFNGSKLGLKNNPEIFGYDGFNQTVRRVTAKVNYQDTGFILSHVHRDSNIPLAIPLTTAARPFRQVENTLSMAGVNHNWIFNNNLDLYTNFAILRQHFRINEPLFYSPDTVLDSKYALTSHWSVLDSRLFWRPHAKIHWLAGIDLHIDHNIQLIQALPALNYEEVFSGQNIQQGYYTELQWQALPWLAVHTSIRYDRNQFELSALSPSVALIMQATPKTLLKFRQSKAVRGSSFVERFYNDAFAIPLPKSEHVHATEFSFEQRIFANWRWFGSFYYNELKYLIFTPQNFIFTTNAFPVRTYGMETGFDLRLRDLRAQISYSRQDGTDGQGQLTNAPKHLGKAQVFYPINEQLSVNWQLYAVAKRPYGQLKLPGFVNQDIGLIWSLQPGLNLQFNLKNATNIEAFEIPERDFRYVPLPSRAVELRLNWTFTP